MMDAGAGGNGKGTRRSWTDKEEEVLIGLLKDLIAIGWKGVNGFRPGYLNLLEQKLAKEFPGTDLRGMPHVNSKISQWKKSYGCLSTMMGRSGVGYNHTTKMISANDDQWDSVVKNDPPARLMRYKSWPYYDDWIEIFGKDRATGDTAEDVLDAVNDLINQDHINNESAGENTHNITPEPIVDETEGATSHQTDKSERSGSLSGKKRKADDGLEGIYDLVGQLCRSNDERLEGIARRIGYEFDVAASRKEVYGLLSGLNGLSEDEKLDGTMMLLKNVEYLEGLSGLPDEAKARFIKRMLGNI